MADYEPGQWVLGRYRGGQFYFPGVAQQVTAGFVTVGYDDGDRETLPLDQVKPYDWEVGSRIPAIWSGNGEYYDATIIEAQPNGSDLIVRFDDGIVEHTFTARCRSE